MLLKIILKSQFVSRKWNMLLSWPLPSFKILLFSSTFCCTFTQYGSPTPVDDPCSFRKKNRPDLACLWYAPGTVPYIYTLKLIYSNLSCICTIKFPSFYSIPYFTNKKNSTFHPQLRLVWEVVFHLITHLLLSIQVCTILGRFLG